MAWVLQAAMGGDAEAMVRVGHMLLAGYGIRTDSSEAAKWLRQAWWGRAWPMVHGAWDRERPTLLAADACASAMLSQHGCWGAMNAHKAPPLACLLMAALPAAGASLELAAPAHTSMGRAGRNLPPCSWPSHVCVDGHMWMAGTTR